MPHVTGQGSALLLAACFTFGCAAIYEMRAWAQALTGILIRVALCLGPIVAVVALARWPGEPARQPVPPTHAAALPPEGRPIPVVRGAERLPDAQRPRSTGMLRSATPAPPSSAAGGGASGPAP